MGKGTVTVKSAAGLRRSAIAERIRIQEEWSSLKGTDDESELPAKEKKRSVLSRNLQNIRNMKLSKNIPKSSSSVWGAKDNWVRSRKPSNEALRGVVALVDVGSETRALALRAALAALGATVVPAWGPHVTHLVWTQGGDRETRAQARALACRVVSPLWVEACAASARRISERVFPSTARDSDLPSPATLCSLLKRAEQENWTLAGMASDSDEEVQPRLRISSDNDDHTRSRASDGDTTIDVEKRVNTLPRRALPISMSPPPADPRARRKLFTAQRSGDDSDLENTPPVSARRKAVPKSPKIPKIKAPQRQKKTKHYNLTQQQRRHMEKAGRLAKRLAKPNQVVANGSPTVRREGTQTQRGLTAAPRIVLSGMSRSQRQSVTSAIQSLNGKVQAQVNRRTTHVLLGSCKEDPVEFNQDHQAEGARKVQGCQNNRSTPTERRKNVSICEECNSPGGLVMQLFEKDHVELANHCSNPPPRDNSTMIVCSSVAQIAGDVLSGDVNSDVDGDDVQINDISELCDGFKSNKRHRTLKTLLGAARGCRVLHARWAIDSQTEGKWLPHIGYEVTHLMKTAQKARIERSVTNKMHADYAYDVFRGIQVHVSEATDQRDAAVQLLSLCGAQIVDNNGNSLGNLDDGRTQNGGKTQNGGRTQNGGATQNGGRTQNGVKLDDGSASVVRIGKDEDEVCSKWVFDSVAAARPRTIRRYINRNVPVLN